jgi:hypothetical protein
MIPKFDSDAEKARIMGQFNMEEINAIPLFGARIIVAKWIRNQVRGVLMSEQTRREDGFQGKVGLVLRVGPLAFQDDDRHDWCGLSAKVGDWAVYSYSSGTDWDYSPSGPFERIPCKTLTENDIDFIVPRPDFAY